MVLVKYARRITLDISPTPWGIWAGELERNTPDIFTTVRGMWIYVDELNKNKQYVTYEQEEKQKELSGEQ